MDFFYHLFANSHAQRGITSNIYFSLLHTLSFCYIMYYIVSEIYSGRRFLKDDCYSQQIISAVATLSLIPYNLTQAAPETCNL